MSIFFKTFFVKRFNIIVIAIYLLLFLFSSSDSVYKIWIIGKHMTPGNSKRLYSLFNNGGADDKL